jgi:hypothetical protein
VVVGFVVLNLESSVGPIPLTPTNTSNGNQ